MKQAPLLIAIVVVVAVASMYFLAKPSVAPEALNNNTVTMNTNAVAPSEGTKNVNMFTRENEADVTGEDTVYFENVKGYLAKPLTAGAYPGVVMIHEWWGLNDSVKSMARVLASQGYVVLAVDLYNGEIAADATKAMALVSSLDQPRALNNLRAAANHLRTTEHAPRLATLGWCFGGGQSMQYALSGDAIDASVIYYGNLVTDETKLAAIDWPVLGIFGEADQAIPVASAHEFDAALDKLGIDNEIYIYPGVGHAFANPSGANYAPNETKDAWEKTLAFLTKHLK